MQIATQHFKQGTNLAASIRSLQTFLILLAGSACAAAFYTLLHPPVIVFMGIVLFFTLIPLIIRFPQQTFFTFLVTRNIADIASGQAIIDIGGFALNLSSLMSILFIIWGSWYFVTTWPIKKNNSTIPLLFFVIISGLSVFTSLNPMASIQEYIKFLNLAFAYLMAAHITRTYDDLKRILRTIVFALIIPSLAGIIQFITKTGVREEVSNRLLGTYGHPNTFAFALIIALCAWMMLVIARPSSQSNELVRQKYTPLAVFLVLGSLLLFTYTRAAWIGITVILFIYGIRFHARKTILLSALLILLTLSMPLARTGLLATTGYDIGRSDFFKRISSSEEDTTSIAWRLRSWQEVSVKLAHLPLLGYGIGMFPQVRETTISYLSDLRAVEAHNDYLRLIIESGYIGAASYALFLISVMAVCLKASRHTATAIRRKQYTIVAGCVTAFIIMSITDNILRGTAVGWLFWSMMGGFVSLARHEMPPPTKPLAYADAV